MKEHCGCCGRELGIHDASPWCRKCKRHVLGPGWNPTRYRPFEDRTYFAQHGKPCPHQVSR